MTRSGIKRDVRQCLTAKSDADGVKKKTTYGRLLLTLFAPHSQTFCHKYEVGSKIIRYIIIIYTVQLNTTYRHWDIGLIYINYVTMLSNFYRPEKLACFTCMQYQAKPTCMMIKIVLSTYFYKKKLWNVKANSMSRQIIIRESFFIRSQTSLFGPILNLVLQRLQ